MCYDSSAVEKFYATIFKYEGPLDEEFYKKIVMRYIELNIEDLEVKVEILHHLPIGRKIMKIKVYAPDSSERNYYNKFRWEINRVFS